MIKIQINETGNGRGKGSKETFGYLVTNDVPGHRFLDYENRARILTGRTYVLEQRKYPRDSSSQFNAFGTSSSKSKADGILYGKALEAAKTAQGGLAPEIEDNTGRRLTGNGLEKNVEEGSK